MFRAGLDPSVEMGDTTQTTHRVPLVWGAHLGGPANVAKVTMPQLGESVAEGTIGKWLKQPGDHVDKYEPLVEVVTDKVNAEVPSPFEGILREILVEEGATVPNNAEIAVIETADDGADAMPTRPPSADRGPVVTSAPPVAATETPAAAAAASGPGCGGRASRQRRAPAGRDGARGPFDTRRGARRRGPRDRRPGRPDDPSRPPAPARARPVRGPDPRAPVAADGSPARTSSRWSRSIRTGSAAPVAGSGRVRRATAPAGPAPAAPASAAPRPPAPPAPASAPIAVPGRRRRSPPADDPDAQGDRGPDDPRRSRCRTRTSTWRSTRPPSCVPARRPSATTRRARGSRSATSRSSSRRWSTRCAATRRSTPTGPTRACVAKRRIHMGVAVAVDDGLLVPVVRDVDQLSISGLNRAIADVAGRARAGKLRLDDYGGSTFTIDNTGWFGSNLTMPIINVPEVAILTMEAITKRRRRPRDARGRRHRHPPDHEHGPRHRPPRQRRRAGGGIPADHQDLARGDRTRDAGLLTAMRARRR